MNKVFIGDYCEVIAGRDKPEHFSINKSSKNKIPVYANGIDNEGLVGYTDHPAITQEAVTVSARGSIGTPFYRNKPYVPIIRLISIIPDNKYLDCLYLYYLLKNSNISGTGSVQAQLTVPMVKQTIINIIKDINVQKSISQVLLTIDNKIANNDKIFTEFESLARTIYDYWFVQFDFPDENGRPYKSSGGKMVWNERLQREIPDGWEVDCLGNHIKIDRGISYSSDELMPDGIPMINLNSFHSNSTYKVEGIKKYSGPYKKINLIQPYDLLICMTQQSPIDITGSSDIIGKAIILPDCFSESEVVMSMDVARLKCDQKYGRYYLKRLLDKDFFHKYMVGFASGTKIKHLHINGLMEYSCEIPDSNLIRKYNQISYNIYCKISEIIKENQQLASLRDFLLPLLMNGQVSFKSDSI